jgi:hypothetical protein
VLGGGLSPATIIAERTGLFFILVATLNCGTTEPNFPAHSIGATLSFLPAAASAADSESLGPIPIISNRLAIDASIPFYSLIWISATQRSR